MKTFRFKTVSVRYHKKRVLACPKCKEKQFVICWGFHPKQLQRYLCKKCRSTFNKRTGQFTAHLHTKVSEVTRCVQDFCEGKGQHALARTSKHNRATLVNWLQRAGKQTLKFKEVKLRATSTSFLQYDELYTYVGHKSFLHYLWTCIDAVSKLWLGFHVSFTRSLEECKEFFKTFLHSVKEVAGATSDGLVQYASLMEKYFPEVPFAQIVKLYQNKRLVEVKKKQCGKHTVEEVEQVIINLGLGTGLNTSFVERFNATLRCFLPCLNRKTFKFPKHVGNFEAWLHVFQVYYNFCLKHRELGTSPAHAAGLSSKPLSLREVLTTRV